MRVLHERLAAAFSLPLVVGDHEIRINVKAGLARFPENGADAESLLQNAEAALHKARKSGERFLRHRREINTEVAERLALEQRLRVALDAGQFELHYQPQFSVATRMLSGAEALLRWRDPGRGLVPPAVFLSVLESTGLIVDVGDWVLVRAVQDLRRWQRLGFESMRIAVNVSPVQLRDPDFAERFFSAAGWQSKCGQRSRYRDHRGRAAGGFGGPDAHVAVVALRRRAGLDRRFRYGLFLAQPAIQAPGGCAQDRSLFYQRVGGR